MAEQVTDEVQRRLGRRRWCHTRDYLLDGAPAEPWQEYLAQAAGRLTERHGLSPAAAHHLLKRYGTRAFEAVTYLRLPADRERLVAGEPDLAFELRYQRENEMALTPQDHWMRRTRLGLLSTP